MDQGDRCNEEFWDTHCDQPRGHRTMHSARKGTARITWGRPDSGPSAPVARADGPPDD